MDEFDDFDIGPQADEVADPLDIDTDDLEDIGDDDALYEEDEVIDDEDDLRPYSSEWDEDGDDDWDLDD